MGDAWDRDRGRVRALAEAEAEKAARVGIAQALAIEEQVRASGGPQLQLTRQVMERFSEAVERPAAPRASPY